MYEGFLYVNWRKVDQSSNPRIKWDAGVEVCIGCMSQRCSNTPMEGGSAWNLDVGDPAAGNADQGSMLFFKTICCGTCSEDDGLSLPSCFSTSIEGENPMNGLPDFLRNIFNELTQGTTPGRISGPARIVIRRQLENQMQGRGLDSKWDSCDFISQVCRGAAKLP